jgi:hypothetical protein
LYSQAPSFFGLSSIATTLMSLFDGMRFSAGRVN